MGVNVPRDNGIRWALHRDSALRSIFNAVSLCFVSEEYRFSALLCAGRGLMGERTSSLESITGAAGMGLP